MHAKTAPKENIVYLTEREWFKKKFELHVGKKKGKMIPSAKVEKNIISRKKCEIERHLFHKYKEPPRPDNIPDIVWEGPRLNSCLCISQMDNCNCKGNIILPPRRLPLGFAMTVKQIGLRYVKCLLQDKQKKPFAERFQDHLETEAMVQTELNNMDFKHGPEFCILRCYNHYIPQATESCRYIQQKKKLYSKYKKMTVVKIVTKKGAPVVEETIDGYYRTVYTQATVKENGDFVMGDVSHILFGNPTVYQDIEGTPYTVKSYQEVEAEKPEPIVKKIENLLSISGIKERVSKLTSSLMSSIVDIEDTGIPLNTRATQDPPLDHYFESTMFASGVKVVKVSKEELCPCCNKYKGLQTGETDQVESNVIVNYDDFESTVIDSAFNAPFERRHLGFRDNDNQNIVGKQIPPQKTNPLLETTNNDENESKVRNINDNIELLKQDLRSNKSDKKYRSVDRNNELYAIQSESMLNEEEENKIDQKMTKIAPGVLKAKKNNLMNSLEFLESIKPCCIDNLFKRLETKITNEKFVKKILGIELLRKVDRCIQKIEKERLQELENIRSGRASVEKSKPNKLISSINITIKKFSDFIKKQKSSLKAFTKKVKDAHLRAKHRNALSLEDFKIKVNKSFKKMNNAVSSFCKRRYKKSSNNLRQFMSSFKKSTVKANSLEDSESKATAHPCERRCHPLPCQKMSEKKGSNTSEKEVFSVQYSSTLEFNSEYNDQ